MGARLSNVIDKLDVSQEQLRRWDFFDLVDEVDNDLLLHAKDALSDDIVHRDAGNFCDATCLP